MNKNFLCSYYCLRPTNLCCDCHSCPDLIFIEEILTWICIGSIIIFFYNTIKLCIIIAFILWMIYWITQRTDIIRLFKKKSDLKNVNDEPLPDDNQLMDIPVQDNNQDSLPNFDDTKTTQNNNDTKADSNFNEVKELKRNVLPKQKSSQLSRTKKLFIDNTQEHEKLSLENSRNEQNTSSDDKQILNDLHQTIGHLHDDILQLKSNSSDEQKRFKLTTENLIQKIISNRMDNNTDIDPSTEIQHPNCVTAQPSIAVNSLMPSVPNRSTVIAISEDDENSCDNCITTSEQFENIVPMKERKSDSISILNDSMLHSNESPNWAYYSTKPDLFSTTLRTDLPVVQSEEQQVSFKQNFLSHFRRRPKLAFGNHPATFYSSSLNANDYLKSLKQGIFRVRKNRIINSFDNIQQEKDTNCDVSFEINQLQTKITNSSIESFFQSFKSTIHEHGLNNITNQFIFR